MTTPANKADWATIFDQIELTPEEEKALDALWASPEMQTAVKAAAAAGDDEGEQEEAEA